jgi:glycosyltransferase involved in cell wall biosynthesis
MGALRVTHIITRLIVGGAQENTVDSVLGLRARHGLDVDLISGPTIGPEGSLESAFAPCPQVLSRAPHLVRPLRPWADVQACRELTAMLRARQPLLVHTHSGKAGILGRLAARRAGVPIVVHTIHGPSFGPFQGAIANTLFRWAEQAAARYTTHFVTVAQAMTRQYLAAGIGQPNQFTFVPSGFGLTPFLTSKADPALRARYGFDSTHFVVGKLARLAPLKGHDELLQAIPTLLQQQPQMRFLLIGDGPLRARLERELQERRLSQNVTITGLIPPSQVPALLATVDAVVHLSRREGLPRAITQALAAAKPVVAYDCDGAGEVCRSDETGFLIPPGDRDALVRRLVQLASQPDLRRRLGQHGRELVQAEFSVDHMVDQLHGLYQRLAQAAQTNRSLKP